MLKLKLFSATIAGTFCAVLAIAAAQASSNISAGFITPVQADETSIDRYCWTVYCQTLTLTSYSDPELGIKPVVEAQISCAPPGVQQATNYMEYWYGATEQGLCLGAKMLKTLTIPPGQNSLNIHVVGKQNSSAGELTAATDATVRMILDFKLHDYWINAVYVPDKDFDSISDKFAFYNIRPTTDWSDGAGVPAFGFLLKSDSGERSARMQYRI